MLKERVLTAARTGERWRGGVPESGWDSAGIVACVTDVAANRLCGSEGSKSDDIANNVFFMGATVTPSAEDAMWAADSSLCTHSYTSVAPRNHCSREVYRALEVGTIEQ